MPTAERRGRAHGALTGPRVRAPSTTRGRLWAWGAVAIVLAAALGLRLWGVRTGLPYVYNIDEAGHFVPKAVQMFEPGHGLNPRYFVNPPALTYVLHLVLAIWFGGGAGVLRAYRTHPDHVFLLARIVVAVLGTGAVWLLYLLGARLFCRGVGLLAAAIEAVAFLPVFYGHFALNDASTLLPLTLSLYGSAGVLRHGRRRDYALAGIGLGFACAGKYTAGIALVPLLAAAGCRYLDVEDSPPAAAPTVLGLAIAGACAFGAFLIANPYALLDFNRFHSELIHQSSLSGEAQGKLGAPKQSGVLYYLWSLTWGLGWVPALAALAGAVAIWRRDARAGWLLVPAPLLFLAFMGLQDRYFGRWLLPIFPILALLAAWFAVALAWRLAAAVSRVSAAAWRAPATALHAGAATSPPGAAASQPVAPARRGRTARALVIGAFAVLLLAQGLRYSVHDDTVLARADTRNVTRAWMVAHIPRGERIVLEPIVLDAWVQESPGAPTRRWQKYSALLSVISPDGALAPQDSREVALEDYETTLSPALLGWYERQRYCWVITGSTESGRALVDPAAAPQAVAYYRALASPGRARVALSVGPYARGSAAPGFNFDWSFDYYPLAYRSPGPQMTVYRLLGPRCRSEGAGGGRVGPYPK
jgi:4-amino-4-deoxy-L-arabinose transferase-like glycosyltransferase